MSVSDRTLPSLEFILRGQGLPSGEPAFPGRRQPHPGEESGAESLVLEGSGTCTGSHSHPRLARHEGRERIAGSKGGRGSYLGSQGTEQGEQKAQGSPGSPGSPARPWGPHRCAARCGHSGRRR